jgi:hypothetical protein
LGHNCGLGYRLPTYIAYAAQLGDGDRPLVGYRGQPRLTPALALTEIESWRQQELTAPPKAILDDLRRYVFHQARQWERCGGG